MCRSIFNFLSFSRITFYPYRFSESVKHYDHLTNGGPLLPPEYVPPPPPAPIDETIMMNGGYCHEDSKYSGIIYYSD